MGPPSTLYVRQHKFVEMELGAQKINVRQNRPGAALNVRQYGAEAGCRSAIWTWVGVAKWRQVGFVALVVSLTNLLTDLTDT